MNRRLAVGAAVALPVALAAAAWRSTQSRNMGQWRPYPDSGPDSSPDSGAHGGMRYREFGRSGVRVSEVGFGAWAIGGQAYGAVPRTDALRALARAEELGCNFVDTAMVYGDSELVLGEFLAGRRDRWLVATKYSGQQPGLEGTLEEQLRRMRIEAVDFYQVHWAPGEGEQDLYEALYRVRKAGKARLVGVSLNSIADIHRVLTRTEIDGFQVPFNLLSPDPYLAKLDLIRSRRPGIVIRSTLREGFLTGKYRADSRFPDPADRRHKWSPQQIAALVGDVERFRFLEQEAGSMLLGAARYPLAFAETSTVILGTKSMAQAEVNFGQVSGPPLSAETLQRIETTQRAMRAFNRRGRLEDGLRRLFS
ncbi:MAG: aldo/keto reductase [Gammaproteobacteria bacterium]|nr:aldo/keto reductase [Gammaproteobacteria bacterium]